MNPKESVLATAIHNLFSNDPSVMGIAQGKPGICDSTNCMPHQWEWINDIYKIKLVDKMGDSPFFESVSSAFYDIHSYKFIEDHKFNEAMILRLRSVGVPKQQIQIALECIQETIDQVKKECEIPKEEEFDERSAGWHHDLKEVMAASQQFNKKPTQRSEPASGGGAYPAKKELSNITEDTQNTMLQDEQPLVDIGYSRSMERILRDLNYKIKMFENAGRLDAAKKYNNIVEEMNKVYKATRNEQKALQKYEEMIRPQR